MNKRAWRSLWLGLGMLGAGPAWAAGFANEDLSISGVGLANAVIAGVYDASAASYNPSAIGWTEGLQLQVSSNGRFRNNSVKVPGGVLPNLADAPDAVSTQLTWMPHSSNFGLGVSLTTPFYNVTSWSTAMPTVPNHWLQVRRATLDLVYVVSSTFAVAHGVDYYYAKTLTELGAASFAGKDKSSFGGHVSFSWKFMPQWQMGMMLRKAPRLDLKDQGNSQRIELPDQIGLGISHDIADALRWEMDAEWSRWSSLKDASVKNASGAVVIAAPVSLRDSIAVRTGVSWLWRRDSALRFGYAYDQGANKRSAFQPMLSDQSGHRLSIGMGGEMFDMYIDLAYSYTFFANQTVTGSYAGKYRDRRQTLGVALSKTF